MTTDGFVCLMVDGTGLQDRLHGPENLLDRALPAGVFGQFFGGHINKGNRGLSGAGWQDPSCSGERGPRGRTRRIIRVNDLCAVATPATLGITRQNHLSFQGAVGLTI